jgi:hypothetical protein
LIVFFARLLVALLSYSVFVVLWVLLKMMTNYEAPLVLNYFVVACIGFASWETGCRMFLRGESSRDPE